MNYALLTVTLVVAALVVIVSETEFTLPGAGETHFHELGVVHADEGQKWTCGMHPMIITDEPGLCPICNMELTPLKTGTGSGTAKAPAGEKKVKYWVAPMDPTYISDQPGKSPMGMDLVPVYEDEATGGSLIAIDPVTVQNMGLRTAQVVQHDLSRSLRTVGLVAYPEPKQFHVTTKIDGWIESLRVAELGQQVRKGEVLFEIYSPELVTAQEEYLLALKNLDAVKESPFSAIVEGAQRLRDASRKRLEYWNISERQIKRLEQTRAVRRTLQLTAPYDGVVVSKSVLEGGFVKAGSTLMEIADIRQVWIQADIYEYELPWVHEGLPAEIELPYKGETLRGVISRVYPYVEARTRTVKARIELDNPGYQLKPDMYVNVRIVGAPIKDALVVPAEAVLSTGVQETVFVALGDGRFEPRAVKTGLRDDLGHVEILRGLFAGEQVVTSAQFMLDSESKLREAIRKMMEPPAMPSGAPAAQGESLDALFDEGAADKKQEKLEDLFK